MDNLSAFQLLPYHVVKLVVNHVAGSRLQLGGAYTGSVERSELLIPLLWVCHNFRTFVRERFCRVYELTLENDRDRAEAVLYSWPTRFKEFGYPTHLLAKELQGKLDIKSVFTGKALQLLSDAPYEGCSFPLIRKLRFELTSDEEGYYDQEPVRDNNQEPVRDNDGEPVHNDNGVLEGDNGQELVRNNHWEAENGNGWDPESDNGWDPESAVDWALEGFESYYTPRNRYIFPPDTAANITAFVQRIKQMAPTISEIDVINDYHKDHLLSGRDDYILDLVRQLFGVVEKHTVISRDNYSMVKYLDLEPFRDLVHIHYSMDKYFTDVVVSLIPRSARTLQSLNIDVCKIGATILVSHPAGGGYLEYPCLHTLKVSSFSRHGPSHKAVLNDIVPFPRLLRLTVSYCCPFGDDILFRGNAATLEYLKVVLLPETVSMLRKYRVFTPTSHPNLKCVVIGMSSSDMPDAFATGAEYMKFVLSIAPGASVREIVELNEYPEDRTLALSMLKDHGCIQILSLPDIILSLWEAISLVKSLPLLSDLRTFSLTVGELPQGVSMTMLPGHVRATYAPMGKRFRCWHVRASRFVDVNYVELATCMLSLALACPNFDYAAVDGDHREEFMKAMQDKIAEPEFSQNEPRLRRLLFSGWKNC
ncbi:hypothetical protein GGH94_000990 [Coemansia aciculifera]|uniref:Uncharacterized protein n=1 Tax=Coemansia aciculifera TaxID=417176 RepID=A0A9W8M7C1_9FUNG|nr:hypothetical protein GGH94_000990 [Coemansia aciculifera]